MPSASTDQLTELLVAWSEGNKAAEDALLTLVYHELRRLARRHLAAERPGVLQTTALVHELYLRLADQRSVCWKNRRQFYAIAACLTRRILIDHARHAKCERRGAGAFVLELDEAIEHGVQRSRDLLALDDALDALKQIDPRKSQIVELRFFGGLTVEEIAEALGVSGVTVMRDWRIAKAWLHREIRQTTEGVSSQVERPPT